MTSPPQSTTASLRSSTSTSTRSRDSMPRSSSSELELESHHSVAAPPSDSGASSSSCSDWSPSDRSDVHIDDLTDDPEDDSFDLVQSHEWASDQMPLRRNDDGPGSRKARSRTSSADQSSVVTCSDDDKMKLSYPDPLGEDFLITGTPSESSVSVVETSSLLGAEDDKDQDEGQYSFLFDAKVNTSTNKSNEEEHKIFRPNEATAKQDPANATSDIATLSPKSRARDITRWVQSTEVAHTDAIEEINESTCDSVETLSLIEAESKPSHVVKIAFLGGWAFDHDAVIEQLTKSDILPDGYDLVLSPLEESNLVIWLIDRRPMADEVEIAIASIPTQTKILPVVYSTGISPATSQASIASVDSSATIVPSSRAGQNKEETLDAGIARLIVSSLGSRMLGQQISSMSALESDLRRHEVITALGDLTASDRSAVSSNDAEAVEIAAVNGVADSTTRGIHAKLDELDASLQKQAQTSLPSSCRTSPTDISGAAVPSSVRDRLNLSRALVVVTAALALAAAALLESTPSFGAMVSQSESSQPANHSSLTALIAWTTKLTPSPRAATPRVHPCSKGRKKLSIPSTLPPSPERLGIESSACSFTRPANCALALVRSDSNKALSLFSNPFNDQQSLEKMNLKRPNKVHIMDRAGYFRRESQPYRTAPVTKLKVKKRQGRLQDWVRHHSEMHEEKTKRTVRDSAEYRWVKRRSCRTKKYSSIPKQSRNVPKKKSSGPRSEETSNMEDDLKRMLEKASKFTRDQARAVARQARIQARKLAHQTETVLVPEVSRLVSQAANDAKVLGREAKKRSERAIQKGEKIARDTARRAEKITRHSLSHAKKHQRRAMKATRIIAREMHHFAETQARILHQEAKVQWANNQKGFPRRKETIKRESRKLAKEADHHLSKARWTIESLLNGEIKIGKGGKLGLRNCEETRDVKACRERRKRSGRSEEDKKRGTSAWLRFKA